MCREKDAVFYYIRKVGVFSEVMVPALHTVQS